MNNLVYVLYNWPAAMAGSGNSSANPSGIQGVCPTGWHIPSDAEWTELSDYLGGENVAGGKLKETGTTHWTSPNIGATNETGFTALPGGYRFFNGFFIYFDYVGWWWSTTESHGYFESNAYFALSRNMINEARWLGGIYWDKEVGFSVRCVRD